jgi:hypothetical protein
MILKEFKYFNPKKAKKWFLSSKKYDPGCSSRIRMLTFSHPGSRGQKDTQSRIRIRNTRIRNTRIRNTRKYALFISFVSSTKKAFNVCSLSLKILKKKKVDI